MKIRVHACLALSLLAALPLQAQQPPASSNRDASGNHAADAARASRKAQLMAEFRALLDKDEAARVAPAASAAETAPAHGATANAAVAPSQQVPTKLWPKDPLLDYSGAPCEYFIRPASTPGLPSLHGEGTWIAYGQRMYQCVGGRWQLEGPVAAFADGAQRQATLVER